MKILTQCPPKRRLNRGEYRTPTNRNDNEEGEIAISSNGGSTDEIPYYPEDYRYPEYPMLVISPTQHSFPNAKRKTLSS